MSAEARRAKAEETTAHPAPQGIRAAQRWLAHHPEKWEMVSAKITRKENSCA
ncbi:MAG: hypothetical protein HYX37_04680 [Rhizobiales bacterium]|nr:hypothetical protein [Hyphomicrobiales bacterium]